jgi:hypothetical protein
MSVDSCLLIAMSRIGLVTVDASSAANDPNPQSAHSFAGLRMSNLHR